MTTKSNFSSFTNLYELSKTLRFELRPFWLEIQEDLFIWNENFKWKYWTEFYMNKNNIFWQDKTKDEYRKYIKYYLDKLHRKFIEKSLESLKYEDFNIWDNNLLLKFEEKLKEWKDEKDKTKKETLKKELWWESDDKDNKLAFELRKIITEKFKKKAIDWYENYTIEWENKLYDEKLKEIKFTKCEDKWKFKESKAIFLLQDSNVIYILKELFVNKLSEEDYKKWDFPYKKEDISNLEKLKEINEKVFKEFEGFWTYFTSFNASRENLYKDDGISWALATRIINENFVFFLENKFAYETKNKDLDFKEVENNFYFKINDFFSLKNYIKYVLQWDETKDSWINLYNKIVWWIFDEATKQRKKWLNEIINNEWKQKNKKDKFIFFKELHKQILWEVKAEEQELNKENIWNFLIDFLNSNSDFINNCFFENDKKTWIYDFFKRFCLQNEDFEINNIYFRDEFLEEFWRKFLWIHYHEFEQYWELKKWLPKTQKEKWENYKLKDYITFSDLKANFDYFENKENPEHIALEWFFKEKYFSKTQENPKWLWLINENKSYYENFLNLLWYEFNKIFNWQPKNEEIELNAEDERLWITIEQKRLIWIYEAKEKLEQFLMWRILFESSEEREKYRKKVIKDYADNLKNLEKFFNVYFLVRKKSWKTLDPYFYNHIETDFLWEWKINKDYNSLRNYLTKKPFEENKIKLNFENPILAWWWDKNEEDKKSCVIFRKNWKYFLWVMKKWSTNLFKNYKFDWQNDFFEKMDYKFFPDASKMIPKCSTQLNKVKTHFENNNQENIIINWWKIIKPLTISRRIFDLNNVKYDKNDITKIYAWNKDNEWIKLFQKDYYKLSKDYKNYKEIFESKKIFTYEKLEKLNKFEDYQIFRKALNYWIDFCKEFLKSYESTKNFDYSWFLESEKYESLDKFYHDIDIKSYDITFSKVSEDYINEKTKKWELFLFEIYNKDFSDKKSWNENLHTMYFKWLFSPENLENPILKLNWEAELFFRKWSLKENKENRAKNNLEKSHEITTKERYVKDKLLFHCPINLNFCLSEKDINYKILNYISDNWKDINIIWIDRWEKHLLYYSVINQNWEILKDENWKLLKWSLNEIYWQNYFEKLTKREDERKKARWDWEIAWNIKDLKKWYLSQVVKFISELIVKHNAIVVLEDLNSWFKRWRQKIEKNVYQQFEKTLIEKLNYLVLKDKNLSEKWSYLQAYQLTAPFDTFKKLWKQTWVLFYTQANYTSQTCPSPSCGFRRDLYLKYKNEEQAKNDFKEIESIVYEKEKDRFVIEYWKNKVYSNVERMKYDKTLNNNKWWTLKFNVNDCFKILFGNVWIDYKSWNNIKNEILKNWENKVKFEWHELENFKDLKIFFSKSKKIFENFFYFFSLILSLRNSESWKNWNDSDYISCPSCYFDSRKIDNEIWVENWDDNGAFNIARKWIMIIEKINDWKKENDKLLQEWKKEKSYPDLYIKIEEFDQKFRK